MIHALIQAWRINRAQRRLADDREARRNSYEVIDFTKRRAAALRRNIA